MAAWIAFPTLIFAERRSLPVRLLPVSLLMIFRICVNLFALVLSSRILDDMGQAGIGGVFTHVFSMELKASKRVGDHIFSQAKPLWTAFEGRGITLGRRQSSPS